MQELVEQSHRLRNAVIGLSVGAASAWFASRPTLETIGVIGGIAAVPFLWHHPQLSMAFALAAILWFPWSIGTGTYTVIPAGVALWAALILAWLARSILARTWILPRPLVATAVGVFAGSALLSIVAGNLPWSYFAERASPASQFGGLFIFLVSVSTLTFVGAQLPDFGSLRRGTMLFAVLALPFALSRLLPFVGGSAPLLDVFGGSVLGSQFWIWWLVIVSSQALFNQDLSPSKRVLILVVGVLPLYGSIVYNRDWASGWLPPLIALITLITLRSTRLAAVIAAIGLLFSATLLSGLAATIVNDDLYSAVTREAAARILLENVIPLSPVFGLGPSNYYFYTPLFPIMGYAVRFNSHNNYLDILAQTGIVGLTAFGWLFLMLAITGMRLRNRVHGFSRGYVNACLAGISGMLAAGFLGDWVVPFAYNIRIEGLRASLLGWIALGGMIALERFHRETIKQ